MKRVQISLNIAPAVRDALDARVREGAAKCFPVERAALASRLLETALQIDDAVKVDDGKAFVRAMTALLGEIRPLVPGLDGRVEAALRGAGLAEDRIETMMSVMGLEVRGG